MNHMPYTINPRMPRLRMEAVKLVKQRGWSLRRVARYYGYNPSTVSRWLKKSPDDMRQTIPTLSSSAHHRPNALSEDKVRAIVKTRLAHNRCAEVVHKELENTSSGRRFYVYMIIDLYSRWAYAEVTKKISAGRSVVFLRNARKHAKFNFVMIQSDNGPEFSQWFTRGVSKLNIAHRHSRVRKCNDNAHIERFNRTIQEECFGTKKPVNYDRYLSLINDYLKYYNNTRLHLSLGLQTPARVLRGC